MYKQAIVNNLIKIAVVYLPWNAKDKYVNDPYAPAGFRYADLIGAGTGAALGAGAGYLYNRNKKNKYNKELAKINANKQLNKDQRDVAIAALKKPSLAKHMLVGGGIGAGAGYLAGLGTKGIYNANHKVFNPKYSIQDGPNVINKTKAHDYVSNMPGQEVSIDEAGISEAARNKGYVVRRDGNRYSIEIPTATGRRDHAGRPIATAVQFGGDINDLTPDKVNQIMGSIVNRGNFVEPITDEAAIDAVMLGNDLEAKKNLSQQYVDALLSTGNGYTYEPKGTAWNTAGNDDKVSNEDDILASVYDLLTNKDLKRGRAGAYLNPTVGKNRSGYGKNSIRYWE